MSRMTKEEKEDFVKSVMRSIPRKSEMSPSAIITELDKRYSTKVPSDVKAFMKKYPGCVAMESPELKGFPRHHVDDSGEKRWRYVRPTFPKMVRVEDVDFIDLIKAAEEYDAETLKRQEMANNLKAAIHGFNTIKQVSEAYPELSKFLPVPAARSYPLTNPNLVAGLKKAGLKV
jgi:hypothetical protein